MATTISPKKVKTLTANHNVKPPPRYKTPSIDPDIYFYEIEDGDKNEEGEES